MSKAWYNSFYSFAVVATILLVIAIFCTPVKLKTTVKKKVDKIRSTFGIDISHHQGNIKWSKLGKVNKKPIKFIYIKATEGASHIDDKLNRNFYSAQAKGIPVGTYHYFKTTSRGQDQYLNYHDAVKDFVQDLIPMVDVEERGRLSDQEFHKSLQLYLDLIENEFGKKPLIYTGNSFYNDYLRDKYKNYYFCIARYDSQEPILRDSLTWTLWQFTESEQIKGINENVDVLKINPKRKLKDLML